jgi:hypothetical protein
VGNFGSAKVYKGWGMTNQEKFCELLDKEISNPKTAIGVWFLDHENVREKVKFGHSKKVSYVRLAELLQRSYKDFSFSAGQLEDEVRRWNRGK